jgi:hypothetical protein
MARVANAGRPERCSTASPAARPQPAARSQQPAAQHSDPGFTAGANWWRGAAACSSPQQRNSDCSAVVHALAFAESHMRCRVLAVRDAGSRHPGQWLASSLGRKGAYDCYLMLVLLRRTRSTCYRRKLEPLTAQHLVP